ncbi:hypothetical protein [Colwellia hornerae]|uniref:Uncharacterized protein n=1 Tax=Colwellia hornerae TaxID=89402 RepID=A0A5C6Q2Y3_9GAMM|nr:hypothetical protein [Colwellia hornerae]TWX52770.1 hypothetical protein ESZ28_11025 [Colwellia hornerae]TWX59124.1 hypothetical protein ESZ26_10405 [Colwellia hornerae]TWX63138.1 hypothetical protein ESZ27_17810 [Colwellia hornerae]
MKNKSFLKQVAAISAIAIVVWLFWPSIPQQVTIVNEPLIKKIQIKTTSLPKKQPNNNTPLVATVNKITSNDSAALVAQAYAAELTFPSYSQPLTDKDFDRLAPNFFNPQSMLVDDEGTQVSAALSKYRYTYPEVVFATLTGENITAAELQLVDISTGKVLLTSQFEQGEENWHSQFDGERDLPRQLQASIKAKINGKNINITLALKYVDSVATLEGFEPAFNENADMVLKANITTREQGLYRMRANLFDANYQPIAHLVSKETLNKGNSHLYLKAHQSVLKGRQAPFYLSTFSIELMSPAPGQPTKYGDSSIDEYKIKDFAVTSLSNLPYQPSNQEQQRLLLLQNMAQGK